MPKRARETSDNSTQGTPKPVNLAYGSFNKANEPIPADLIDRPKNIDFTRFRVAAWNLNGMRAFMAKRSEILKKFWESEHLDVLGITEHKITEKSDADAIETQIKKILGKDIHCVWNLSSVKKGYAGSLAIVRKSVFERCRKVGFGLKGETSDPEGRIITLEFDTIAVVIAYVPNSGQDLNRLSYRTTAWDKQFSQHCVVVGESKPFGTIVAGDLNVAHRDADIWNVDAPHVPKGAGTTPQERASFEKLFLKNGFSDSFAHMHPDKMGWFTYWSVRAGNKPKNRGLRLDYVLVNEAKVIDAYIAPEFSPDGDHAPVGVVLDVDKCGL